MYAFAESNSPVISIPQPTGVLADYLAQMGMADLKNIELDQEAYLWHRAVVEEQHGDQGAECVEARALARAAADKYHAPKMTEGAVQKAVEDVKVRELTATHGVLRDMRQQSIILTDKVVDLIALTDSAIQISNCNTKRVEDGIAGAVTDVQDTLTALQAATTAKADALTSKVLDGLELLKETLDQQEAKMDTREQRLMRFWGKAVKWMTVITVLFILLMIGLIVATALAPRAHAQSYVNANLIRINGTAISAGNPLPVNVVAGGAGGGLSQLQVGQASDGAFVNVGYFAGQLNIPVNCVVGCSGGASTPADAFATPTTASLNMAFPMVWNGATWDRWYGDKTNGAFVNVKALPSITIANTTFGATQGTSPWVVSNGGTFAVQAASTIADGASVTLGAKADAKSTATDTTAISAMSVLKEISAMEQAPASRAVTNAGTFAVQAATTIADGADVTLGAKTDAKSTATDATSVSAMQVLKEISAMEQAPASRAVTNAGTFAVQAAATLAAETSKVIGTVNQGTSPWVVSNGGTFATQSAITAASGSIASGAVASGAFASGSISDGANVTLGAKTDAKSTATDATSVTVMQVLKEISAMEQAPASRAVTNAGTFAVQSAATLNAETTKVIGTVRNLGNAGAIFDGPTGSAVPANAILTGGTDGTNTRARYYDPCAYSAWTYYYFNVAANTQIAAAAGASKNYYLCEFTVLPVTAATTVNLVSSATAGNACATSTTAWLTGGTTAATGATVAVNGGFVMPPTASRAYAVTQATNHAICIFASATVTGMLAYAGPL